MRPGSTLERTRSTTCRESPSPPASSTATPTTTGSPSVQDCLPCFEPFIRQGITSFVTGNCGLSAIGFEKDTPYTDQVGGGLFGYRGQTTGVYPWTPKACLTRSSGNAPCNIAVLAGHCSARASVAGGENRPLTPEEEQRMLAILEENLKQGAAGHLAGADVLARPLRR